MVGVPAIAVLPISVELLIAVLAHPSHQGFWVGFGVGAGIGAALVLFDSPPIAYRTMAQRRRRRDVHCPSVTSAAKERLAALQRHRHRAREYRPRPRWSGWVFLLESKRLAGEIRIEAGKLVVRWHEDPQDGYENASIGGRARAAAFDLHARIVDPRPWVQAVVVIWGDFAQRSVVSENVAWVRGDLLAGVVANRPIRYSGKALTAVISRTGDAVRALRAANRPSASK